MRHRPAAVLLAVVLVLAGCGDDDVATESPSSVLDPSSSSSAPPADDGENGDGVEDHDTGDDDTGDTDGSAASVPAGQAAEAFGIDVCVGLLPAFDGRIDDLGDLAADEVLVELARIGGPVEVEDVYGEPTGSCGYVIGDTAVDLVLASSDVGEFAIAVETGPAGDRRGGDAVLSDKAALDAAVAEHHAAQGCTASSGEPFYDFAVIEGEDVSVTVVLLSCGFLAYQEEYRVAVVDGGSLRSLPVPVWTGDGGFEDTDAPVGLGYFEAGELEVFTKYRGPGDCGSVQRWRPTDLADGTVRYETISVREQECSDEPDPDRGGISTWPVVYEG